MSLVHPDKRYTWSDYVNWDNDVRYELIEGVPYMMSSPSQAHQTICGALHLQIGAFLRDRPGKVLFAPFDVRLNAADGDDTVVQPDLLIVCDMAKLDGKSCVGAPDMVIEVLSPSTARLDRLIKLHLYQQAGVSEYWIVDVDTQTVYAFILTNGEYTIRAYADTDIAPVHVLDGCDINLSDVFAE